MIDLIDFDSKPIVLRKIDYNTKKISIPHFIDVDTDGCLSVDDGILIDVTGIDDIDLFIKQYLEINNLV